MTLRHLMIFTAVVDEGGMNKAAKNTASFSAEYQSGYRRAGAALWREIV